VLLAGLASTAVGCPIVKPLVTIAPERAAARSQTRRQAFADKLNERLA